MVVAEKALHNCSSEGDGPQIRLTGDSGEKKFLMNPNKALWEKGDFTEIAAFMRQSGEAVIESMAVARR
jgi:hypothetical protein